MNNFSGLNLKQVEISREKFGNNALPVQKKTSTLSLLTNQFKNSTTLILLFSLLVTLYLKEFGDSTVICLVVVANAILGFAQEYRAQNELYKLKTFIKKDAYVIREGKLIRLNTDEIVVGDIVKIKLGDKIPADGVILEGANLLVNESVLTGESEPVVKGIGNSSGKVFSGTAVVSGYGLFEVTLVGSNSQFGRLVGRIIENKEPKTPLQKKILKLSQMISISVVLIVAILLIVGISRGESIEEMIILSVALSVSAIPEALPISITVALALGMRRLLVNRALVRRLLVAETLGSVNVLCIDKTGTLTEGEMKVEEIITNNTDMLSQALSLNNNNINAVDIAIRKWLDNQDITIDDEKIEEIPFNSVNKFSISKTYSKICVVGAPDIILNSVEEGSVSKSELQNLIISLSKRGKRLVAVAIKDASSEKLSQNLPENLKWIGLVVLSDPVRESVKESLEKCEKAGIKVKVITGDFGETARFVMNEIGFDLNEDEIISGDQLSKLSPLDLGRIVNKIKLFYRTSPDQKYDIVKALQLNGEVVGMMGDGINDAPALKLADVGVVVANATDVSKETADMVILDSNFATLISAIEEGRSIFANLKKIIAYLLSDSFSEVIIVGGSFLFGLQTPLSALQILYINLVADSFPDLALSFDSNDPSVIKQRPVKNQPLLSKDVISLIFAIGIVVNIFVFILYSYLLDSGESIEKVRTFIFALFATESLLYVFSVKSLSRNIWSYNVFSNKVLNISVIIGFMTLIAAFTIPFLKNALELETLETKYIIMIGVISLINIACIEIIKFLSKIYSSKNIL